MSVKTIDLGELTKGEVRSLSGHDRGLAARTLFALDERDQDVTPVKVCAPKDLDALTPSFVQGMFATSIHNLGPDAFRGHYVFEMSDHLLKDIMIGMDRVLMTRKLTGA